MIFIFVILFSFFKLVSMFFKSWLNINLVVGLFGKLNVIIFWYVFLEEMIIRGCVVDLVIFIVVDKMSGGREKLLRRDELLVFKEFKYFNFMKYCVVIF